MDFLALVETVSIVLKLEKVNLQDMAIEGLYRFQGLKPAVLGFWKWHKTCKGNT